mgnify:CR=1 FL=1
MVTRWNSTYEMLQRILDVKNSLMSMIAIHYPELHNITNEDIILIEQICDLLKVFKDCTEEMSSEKQVTLSKVILLQQALKKWCTKEQNKADIKDQVRAMAGNLLETLEKRFKGIEEHLIFSQATLLDPRLKKQGFSEARYFERAKQSLIAHCQKFHPTAPTTNPESTATIQKSSIWDEFDQSVKELVTLPNPKVAAIVEVDKYIQEPLLPRKENPLVWWSERRQIYPSLFALVKSRLPIVATSVPCERIFSKAGQTITERRNRLSGKRVEQILFLNANL